MAAKRTEEYQYNLSQNVHLKHIYRSKPKVEAYIAPATSRTLDLAHSLNHQHNRDIQSIQQHQIQYDNRRIIQRIMSISERKDPQVKLKDYSRYNQFQREFRKKSPHRSEKERLIMLENQKLCKKLMGMGPRIGSRKEWDREHKRKVSYSHIYSKHERDKKGRENPEKLQIRELEKRVRDGLEEQNYQGEGYTLPSIRKD